MSAWATPLGAAPRPEDAVQQRVEQALRLQIERMSSAKGPARLREALEYALFPGGGRLRPLLTVAVALAHGDARPELTDAAAVAVELLHCASLVHDDLPCFDDAALRRGKPTVHKRFDEATAVLVGDALIVSAFEVLAACGASSMVVVAASAVGASRGLIAGQAWELEPVAPLDEYHRAKTGALFQAAAALGAMAAGVSSEPWAHFGEIVGRAYQAADDLADAVGRSEDSGKSVGRDVARHRPSLVKAQGVEGARARLREHCREATLAIPRAPFETAPRAWLSAFERRLAALAPSLG
ncbi:MAG: polyprenyl synthetase family protein [Myxococcales bacterium]|nr:polyprenyl synthetase family protein [Myxococcales bacterium]